jgi:glycosyltransferase involved in cell wall biosynthesis
MKMMKIAILPRSVEILDRLELTVPRSWNELSKRQLLKACRLFASQQKKTEFQVKSVLDLLDMKLVGFKRTNETDLYIVRQKGVKKNIVINADTFRFLSFHLEFLLQESDLVINRVTFIRRRLTRYYGPESKFYNMSYDEYRSAENFFMAYNQTRDVKYLDLLFATLYRKKRFKKRNYRFSGDTREPFNSYMIEERARKLKKVKFEYKLAAFQYFFGCIKHLQEMFPLVFTPGKGGQIYDRVLLSLRMLDFLNGGDVTRNKEILRANVYEVMTRMQAEREKIEQLEKIGKK